jgi:hypothetical protein
MLTLRQARIVFRFLFLLPVALLGLAILGVGIVRTVDELSGTPTPEDTASGLLMLGLALLPLGSALIVGWAIARRPQRFPPPEPSAIAPRSERSTTRIDIDPLALRQPAQSLGLGVSRIPASDGLRLVRRDHWSVGYLAVMVLMMLAVLIGPPSIASGALAFAPINIWLVSVGVWISLFLVLLAMPTATRRVDFLPAEDALVIADGGRERVFGLSRLKALDVELRSESRRDAETGHTNSKSWHPALIGWFEVDGREWTPFALIKGPRTKALDQAEHHRSEMAAIAEPIAQGLSVATEKPEAACPDTLAYD